MFALFPFTCVTFISSLIAGKNQLNNQKACQLPVLIQRHVFDGRVAYLAAHVHVSFRAVSRLIHSITDYEASLGGSNVT